MRISRIDIASYGRIRDRRVAISPGLTVIHGPNESGKTTVMEFIRNTLVPTTEGVYPERARRIRVRSPTRRMGQRAPSPLSRRRGEGTFPIAYRGWSRICSGLSSLWARGTSMTTGS